MVRIKASAARNTGVKATDAKYLCLLDDDDLFLKNRIVHQVDFLEKNTEFQACYCWRIQNGKMICGIEEGDLQKVCWIYHLRRQHPQLCLLKIHMIV